MHHIMNFFLTLFLFFLASTVKTASSTETLTLETVNSPENPSLAISVSNYELNDIANSLILAESWLKNNLLINYPSNNITHIVIANNLLCSLKIKDFFYHGLILPALNNIHYSLTRWGLQHQIKVTTVFSSECFLDGDDLLLPSRVKSVVSFIDSTNSSYIINPHYEIKVKSETLVKTHLDYIKKIGFSSFGGDIKFVQKYDEMSKLHSTMRKLSYVVSTVEGALPPLVGVVGPGLGPTTSPPSPISPIYTPHPHHNHHHNLPPCNPWGGPVVSAPPPATPVHEAPGPVLGQEKLWCVAKPSVPAETLQEAMDYACGDGGAECEEIQANGSCYYPDTVVAHASYAFNSYWQKNKRNAGSCSFGGTAMIINSDPSFLQCRFTAT